MGENWTVVGRARRGRTRVAARTTVVTRSGPPAPLERDRVVAAVAAARAELEQSGYAARLAGQLAGVELGRAVCLGLGSYRWAGLTGCRLKLAPQRLRDGAVSAGAAAAAGRPPLHPPRQRHRQRPRPHYGGAAAFDGTLGARCRGASHSVWLKVKNHYFKRETINPQNSD